MKFQGHSAANRSLHSDLSNLPPDFQKVRELSETMFKSRQKLAMVPFEEIGSYYDQNMAKMIDYYDHRNHCEFHCLLTFVSLTGPRSKEPRFPPGV
jgi:hypothetical protein